jgi:hypothetical protein
MARKINITLSDVAKKHLRILAYLLVSAGLGYLLSILVNRPEAVYLTPIINYILYSVAEELKREGWVEAIRNR